MLASTLSQLEPVVTDPSGQSSPIGIFLPCSWMGVLTSSVAVLARGPTWRPFPPPHRDGERGEHAIALRNAPTLGELQRAIDRLQGSQRT
jgi:hypothetical protein